jgi:hypothetical protein
MVSDMTIALRRLFLVSQLLAAAAAPLSVQALSYAAKPIRATVVDAETGQPVQGVIVNAYWHLEDQGGHGMGPLNVTEAVTDANGVFFMAGWGPMEVPRDSDEPLRRGRLDPDQPWLQLFKPGYSFKEVAGNESTRYLNDPFWTGDFVRASAWDGRVIKIERFRGSDERYLRRLEGARASTALGACWWVKVPHMTAAFIKEGERLKSVRGWNELLRFDEIQELYDGQYCGSRRELLQELLK